MEENIKQEANKTVPTSENTVKPSEVASTEIKSNATAPVVRKPAIRTQSSIAKAPVVRKPAARTQSPTVKAPVVRSRTVAKPIAPVVKTESDFPNGTDKVNQEIPENSMKNSDKEKEKKAKAKEKEKKAKAKKEKAKKEKEKKAKKAKAKKAKAKKKSKSKK